MISGCVITSFLPGIKEPNHQKQKRYAARAFVLKVVDLRLPHMAGTFRLHSKLMLFTATLHNEMRPRSADPSSREKERCEATPFVENPRRQGSPGRGFPLQPSRATSCAAAPPALPRIPQIELNRDYVESLPPRTAVLDWPSGKKSLSSIKDILCLNGSAI